MDTPVGSSALNDLLTACRPAATHELRMILDTIRPSDLTTSEAIALTAVLRPAYHRVVLELSRPHTAGLRIVKERPDGAE